jgi:acetolactate synthase-1/2/3 large subunit
MQRMNGAEALVAALKRYEVKVMFGIPGVQIVDALDAVYREGGIRWISTRHEQTSAYMAFGYAKTTGRTGVAMVLPGPGALNTTAAVGTAYAAGVPVLVISGQIGSEFFGQHRRVLHELDAQLDIFSHLTGWSRRASRAEEIPELAGEALRRLTGAPFRPVELEIPVDLWARQADMKIPPAAKIPPLSPDLVAVEQAAALLRRAARPLILTGSGAVDADITRLAETLNAAVVMTTEGQGVIDPGHPLCAGNYTLWRHPVFKQADTILVVGSRLKVAGSIRLEQGPGQYIIRIDHDREELERGYPGGSVIHADAGLAVEALAEACTGGHSAWTHEEIAGMRNEIRKRFETAAPLQMGIIDAIRRVLPPDGILVPDITNLGFWCDIAYPVARPRTYVDSSYFGTLGYAFPTALGAKIGNPDKPVVAISGDGGFPYASAELATAVQEGINVVTLLFSDDAYGTVSGMQRRRFEGRCIGDKLHNPDYAAFTASFGAIGMRLSSSDDLGNKLEEALEADRPVVIECPVPSMPTTWDVLSASGH